MIKKILYISYDGMTDPLGQSQVLPYLRELTKHGYHFHLISFEKHDRFVKYKDHIASICESAGIEWHPQDYAIQGGLKKTWRQIKRMKNVVNELHQEHSFEMTHCRSYISALAGLELKKKNGVKMIFDMRGFWADERVDGGLWNLKNLLYKRIYSFFKKKELEFFNESDYTISLTQNGKDEIKSWPKINDGISVEVIPCCADLNLFDPTNYSSINKAELRATLGLNETSFILGYVGSIGTWYMLPEMLDFYTALKDTKGDVKFLFVTGEKPDSIFSEARKKGISKDDIVVTSCLHKDVPAHISIFDQSIFFIRPTYSKKASSPTKQGEIMAMGIPLVCNAGVGDTDAIVEKYSAGIVLSELNDANYRVAIEGDNNFDTAKISRGAKEFFSLEEGVKRYLKVYKTLVND